MFDPGKILKVKIELAPGDFGYGRATIVDRAGSQLLVQIKTSKETIKTLPKGTRLWFTNESPKVTFNGIWGSSVLGTQLVQGKTMLVCATPKHEPVVQKRSWPRVAVELPVKLTRPSMGARKEQHYSGMTSDLSRSGLTLELADQDFQNFESGEKVSLVIQSKELDIAVAATVIRVDRQWIAKKSVLGLEFFDLQPPGQEELDRLLVPLGGRPRNPELEDQARQAMGGGMSSWSKTVNANEKNSYALFEDNEEADEIGSASESSAGEDEEKS